MLFMPNILANSFTYLESYNSHLEIKITPDQIPEIVDLPEMVKRHPDRLQNQYSEIFPHLVVAVQSLLLLYSIRLIQDPGLEPPFQLKT